MAGDCEHSTVRFPTQATSAGKIFFQNASRDFAFFSFVISLVLNSDYFAYVARQALDGGEWKGQTPVSLASTMPGFNTKFVRDHRQELLQMFLARSIDNFQRYLVNLTREVLRKQPSILKSKQPTISLEHILAFSSMDDFVHDTIERKINNLGYQGFAALQEWCTGKGIPVVLPEDSTDVLVEFIAVRNLIVHSGGAVDERYVRTVQKSRFAVGELRELAPSDFSDCWELVNEAVKETDAAATVKFALTQEALTLQPTPRAMPTADEDIVDEAAS